MKKDLLKWSHGHSLGMAYSQLNHIGYGLGRNELLTFEEKFTPQGFIVESNLTWYS